MTLLPRTAPKSITLCSPKRRERPHLPLCSGGRRQQLRRAADTEGGETYTLGDATWQILSCDTDMPDLNESSIVIKLTYGNTSFLFTGDATMNTEQGLEMSGYDLKSDVLKVGHHGSAGSTADSFLDAVAPEIAVISVDSESDMGEMYHHPATSTLQRLSQHGIKVYRTDELGTIRITSDGEKLAVSAFATSTDGT